MVFPLTSHQVCVFYSNLQIVAALYQMRKKVSFWIILIQSCHKILGASVCSFLTWSSLCILQNTWLKSEAVIPNNNVLWNVFTLWPFRLAENILTGNLRTLRINYTYTIFFQHAAERNTSHALIYLQIPVWVTVVKQVVRRLAKAADHVHQLLSIHRHWVLQVNLIHQNSDGR